MGLHLGWIPNEPGLRPRDFERPAPTEPSPDPAKVAALQAARHAGGMWSRLLIAVGVFALVLFGLIAVVAHSTWGWAVAGGLAACCWLSVALLSFRRRRAASRLRVSGVEQAAAHAAELAVYQQGKARWAESEAERIATAPRWLQVAAHEDTSRLDVFGGTGTGRQNMVTGLGWELLEQRAVIVLDLTQDRVAEGLLTAAAASGMSVQDYELPFALGDTPLLAGLSGEQIASLIVEVVHADDASATAAGRATDLMILKKIVTVLGADVSMGRLHAALTALLGDGIRGPLTDGPLTDGPPSDGPSADGPLGDGPLGDGPLGDGERASLDGLFGDGFRQQVTGNLVRLAAVVEPLTALGTDVTPRGAARLTCLSLAEGPRDVAADLTAALVVQWVTRALSAGGGMAEGGAGPAVILAGADEQSTRHLGRLTAVCERYDIPLVRTFSRLTEESARHLDTRHTAFMRLATRPEALRAAEHIGLERRFVAGRFSHRHSASRSRTRTTSESWTNTSGRTEGEANTHTTGTTTGQAYSEAEVPRHEQQVHVHVEDHRPPPESRDSRRDEPDHRATGSVRDEQSGGGGGARGKGGQGRDARQDKSVRDGAEKATGAREGAAVRDSAQQRTSDPRPRDRGRSSWGGGSGGSGGSGGFGGSGGKRPAGSPGSPGRKNGRPEVDIMKTRTWFTAHHESDSKTKSWSTTEETSHTTGNSRSRTEGVSVGDEISYELVYDHKVQPETLMALPEDQMLAPHIVEAAAPAGGKAVAGAAASGAPPVSGSTVSGSTVSGSTVSGSPVSGSTVTGNTVTESPVSGSKMVALLIDPSVVGSELVAPVRPHEIPAFEPPAPAVSEQVPDYERVPRSALGVGSADGGSARS
jgi:hypothetical protein